MEPDEFKTNEREYHFYLPPLGLLKNRLDLPFKNNIDFIESFTGCQTGLSKSTKRKIHQGKENLNPKTRSILTDIEQKARERYIVLPKYNSLLDKSSSVSSNAVMWISSLIGFRQTNFYINYVNTFSFLYKRCEKDIDFLEKINKVKSGNIELLKPEVFLIDFWKQETLIPDSVLDKYQLLVTKIKDNNNQFTREDYVNIISFKYYHETDFLFSAFANFELDLSLPHREKDDCFNPRSCISEMIREYVRPSSSNEKLFGCFLGWLIQYDLVSKNSEKENMSYQELANFIPTPKGSVSNDKQEKYSYDQLKKWRNSKRIKDVPGNEILLSFFKNLYESEDESKVMVVFMLAKFCLYLDHVVREMKDKLNSTEIGLEQEEINQLIFGWLNHYEFHWEQVKKCGAKKPPT